jgi:hypothetical protein
MIKSLKWLILIAFLLTPIFGLNEYLFLLGQLGGGAIVGKIFTSPLLKSLKDLILVFCLGLGLISCLISKKMIFPNIIAPLFFSWLLVGFMFSCLQNGAIITLYALRIYLPFLLLLIAYLFYQKQDMEKIAWALTFVGLLEMASGAFQIATGMVYNGFNFFGYNLPRMAGTFLTPNSMAIFLLFVVIMIITKEQKRYFDWLIFVLLSVGVIMTASGIGLIGLCFVLSLYLFQSYRIDLNLRAIFFLLIVFVLAIILLGLPVLTGRAAINESASTRREILINSITGKSAFDLLFGRGLGVGSNTLEILRVSEGQLPVEFNRDALTDISFVSDSLYVSLFSQIGLLGLLLFLALNYFALRNAIRFQDKLAMLAIPLFLLMGFGSVVIELFPINWLYALVLGMAFGPGGAAGKRC